MSYCEFEAEFFSQKLSLSDSFTHPCVHTRTHTHTHTHILTCTCTQTLMHHTHTHTHTRTLAHARMINAAINIKFQSVLKCYVNLPSSW